MGLLDNIRGSKEAKEEKRREDLMTKYHLPLDYNGENNGKYEYLVKYIFDEEMGYPYMDYFEAMLNCYANEGWRLKEILTNQVGVMHDEKNNATIDITVVVFEKEK